MTAVSIAKARKLTDRAKRKEVAAQKKRLAAAAKAQMAEVKDENLAPKVQREPVFGRNGEILRGARLERDGISFRRSNPVKQLAARSEKREFPGIGRQHVVAADRLLVSWEECSGGRTVGCSNYGERAGGTTSTGSIAEAVLAGMHQQEKAFMEVNAVIEFMGGLFRVLHAVVILGIPPKIWGEQCGIPPEGAVWYCTAALDRLVEYFDPKPDKRSVIRSAQIAGLQIEEADVSQ